MSEAEALKRKIQNALDESDLLSPHKRKVLNEISHEMLLKECASSVENMETWRAGRKPIPKPGGKK